MSLQATQIVTEEVLYFGILKLFGIPQKRNELEKIQIVSEPWIFFDDKLICFIRINGTVEQVADLLKTVLVIKLVVES